MKYLLPALAVCFMLNPLLAQVDCIKGDCHNGQGTCIFPSGAKYVGDFRNGKIHGQGILYFSNGDKYVGNWVNQYREGEGRFTFQNGDEYLGAFQDNEFNGEGTMTYANGNRYVGQWRNDKQHGQGTFYYANGDRYEGGFQEGLCHGQGTLHYAAGGRYAGQWERNQPHGRGVLLLPNGELIEGTWELGEYQAEWSALAFSGDTTFLKNCNEMPCSSLGKYTYPDGSRYVGEFRSGKPDGIGTMYYANGDRYDGQWRGDVPQGRGTMHYATGKIVGAYWERGKPAHELFVERRSARGRPVTVQPGNDVKIWAVVIGAAHYNHMPTLRYTDDDAYQVFAFLKSPEGGALPDNQMRLLIDEDATRENIIEAMRSTFMRADDNDVLLFYFSGHGLQGSFLPIDYDGQNNLLEHQTIKTMLASSRAKHKIVLADACHSGSLLAYKAPTNILEKYYKAFETTPGGTALLMSSKGEEYSLEDGGLRSGIFSHFLVAGLKGGADTDGNQIITVGELFDYVHQKVRMYTGNVQTPTLTGNFDRNMPVAVMR